MNWIDNISKNDLKRIMDDLNKLHLYCVKSNGSALQYVPEEFKNKELCCAAVKQTGWALAYVPEELKDTEMCLIAVRKSGLAFQWVPEELKEEVKNELD